MNFQRVLAVAQKEWREIVRDKLFFSLAFIVPVLLMLMFGYGLSLDVENIPMAIVDHDGSAASRDYAAKFIDSRYFQFLGYSHDEGELTPLLTGNRIRAAVIIPEHFEKDLLAGRPAQVQTLIDGTFPFRAQTTKVTSLLSTALSVLNCWPNISADCGEFPTARPCRSSSRSAWKCAISTIKASRASGRWHRNSSWSS